MQKISSLHQFILEIQQILESHDLIKCHTHFWPRPHKIIKVTLSFPEFVSTSGFNENIKFLSNQPKKGNRKRQLIWFNPPYSLNVKANANKLFTRPRHYISLMNIAQNSMFFTSYYIHFKLLMILFSNQRCLLKAAFFWKTMLVVIYAEILRRSFIATIYKNFKSVFLLI